MGEWYMINCEKHGIVGNSKTECDMCAAEKHQSHHAYMTEQYKQKSDGGPTGYYDIPGGCKTLNDVLEWLAVERWGKFSLHMKDIMKAAFRYGGKVGTEQEYDANKIIYFGCRLLVMVSGKAVVRKYLQKLLDDPQFK